MRLLSHHVANAERCLLVSPGTSSNHVLECLGFGHVATVNRAALITPGPIELASCMDLESLKQISPAYDRIRSFLGSVPKVA